MIVNYQESHSCLFRTNWVSFRIFRRPLFPKPVSWLWLFFCRYIHQDSSRKTFFLAPQNKLYLIKWDCQWVKIEAWTRYWPRCEIILRFIHCRVCSNFLYKKLLKTQDEEIEAILAYEDEVKTQGHRNRYNLIDRQSMLERIYKPHYDYQSFSPLANGTDLNRQKYAMLQTHWD